MNISVHQVVLDCTDARQLAEFSRHIYAPSSNPRPPQGA